MTVNCKLYTVNCKLLKSPCFGRERNISSQKLSKKTVLDNKKETEADSAYKNQESSSLPSCSAIPDKCFSLSRIYADGSTLIRSKKEVKQADHCELEDGHHVDCRLIGGRS